MKIRVEEDLGSCPIRAGPCCGSKERGNGSSWTRNFIAWELHICEFYGSVWIEFIFVETEN